MPLLKILSLGFILFIFISLAGIILTGLQDSIQPSDVIVVLGNKVETNGLPSNRLQSRLTKAKELYDSGSAAQIIVSGGLGKEGFEEAEVMKNYLVSQGVPPDAIIVDTYCFDSYQTAKNVKSLLKEKNLTSVIIVTSYYHIARTKLAFTKVGITSISSVHANYFELRDVYSLLREVPAYYYYLLRKD